MADKTYIAIDLKSFYASVECRERSLDPMETNLVVADPTRTSKTICLAVSPALKAYGIPGRPRLFEVEQKIRDVEAEIAKNSSDYMELQRLDGQKAELSRQLEEKTERWLYLNELNERILAQD